MSVLLETKNLKKYYGKAGGGENSRQALVKALDDVSLTIEEGKSLALIGESGSGKTTFGKMICGLESLTSGQIFFQGREIDHLSSKEMRGVRKDMQMIFQSSGGVFDPMYTVRESITEVLKNYMKMSAGEYQDAVDEVLTKVGLEPSYGDRYVRNLSGGQCQRANIARALALHPKLVICDEPVSSLDYSIRKQILNLLREMQEEYGLTYLLITHDLSNVPYVCQQVAIMYQGTIVEYIQQTDHIQEIVAHPYTKLLFRSIPAKHPKERKLLESQEEQAVTQSFEKGCSFRNRCKMCTKRCQTERPMLHEIAQGHQVACHCFE